MVSAHFKDIQEDILQHLSDGPKTITDLARVCNRPYTSVQQAAKFLADDNKITKFDRRARNARWTLGANNGPKSTVPMINFSGELHKMTDFRGTRAIPDSVEEAANTVLRAWTVIAMTAVRLNNGVPDDVLIKRLKRQQPQLREAREAFETMAFFCTQLMENPKFWSIESIIEFTNDKDWKDFQPYLEQMYQYYFGDEK